MDHKAKINQLHKAIQDAISLRGELDRENREYCQANRGIPEGTIVEVFNMDTNQKVAEGVVGKVYNYVFFEDLYIKEYVDKISRFEKDRDILRYEIFAIKKNGEKSEKHLFQHPHYIPVNTDRGNYYIKVKG